MIFSEEFGDLCTQYVTRQAFVSEDVHGKPSYGNASTHLCRVVNKIQFVRSTQSARSETTGSVRELKSSTQIWTDPVGWDVKDKITMPDGATPLILDVKSYPDQNGPHHEVVFV
jgi:hypothetical protein